MKKWTMRQKRLFKLKYESKRKQREVNNNMNIWNIKMVLISLKKLIVIVNIEKLSELANDDVSNKE